MIKGLLLVHSSHREHIIIIVSVHTLHYEVYHVHNVMKFLLGQNWLQSSSVILKVSAMDDKQQYRQLYFRPQQPIGAWLGRAWVRQYSFTLRPFCYMGSGVIRTTGIFIFAFSYSLGEIGLTKPIVSTSR